MTKISILGCGWLGLPLAKSLIVKGFELKGSTTSSDKQKLLSDSKIESYRIDLNNIDEPILTDFLSSDILIFAIPPSKINLNKLPDLIFSIEKSSIKKVIVISSTGIYAECNTEINENNADDFKLNESALSQIETAFKNNSNFDVTILQMAGLIGYDRHPGKYSNSPRLLSNPNGSVNLIHRDDAIRLVDLVISKNCWGETFMCCSDQHPTKKEFYTKAAMALGLPTPIFVQTTNDSFKIISNEKVKEKLNFSFLDLFSVL